MGDDVAVVGAVEGDGAGVILPRELGSDVVGEGKSIRAGSRLIAS